MIKEKLAKQDFSTHEGLKKYVRAYIDQEQEEYRIMKWAYYGFAVLMLVAGLYMGFDATDLINTIAGFGISVIMPISFFWMDYLHRSRVQAYTEKLKELSD